MTGTFLNRACIVVLMIVNKISLEKKGIEALLSPLESDILRILWSGGSDMLVRDVHGRLIRKNKSVAITSVAVMLDRLHKKGVVSRQARTGRGGTHYLYSARADKKAFERSVVESVVNSLISNFGPSAVSYFGERFSGEEDNNNKGAKK